MQVKVFVVLVLTVPSTPCVAFAASGVEMFAEHCASCHGSDGKGRTPAGKKLRVKDLAASKLADHDIEKQIVNGTQDAKGNARMPEFKTKLSPDEIAALVAYVKTLRH
jgi:mono/diheme cytochrome c family protein